MAKKKPNKKKRRANYQAPTKNEPKQKAVPAAEPDAVPAGQKATGDAEPAPKKEGQGPSPVCCGPATDGAPEAIAQRE